MAKKREDDSMSELPAVGNSSWVQTTIDDPQAAAAQSAAPADASAPAPQQPPPPAPDHHLNYAPHVALNIFLAAHPLKPDQLAGFKSWALRHHPGKHTVAQWVKFLKAFNERTIR